VFPLAGNTSRSPAGDTNRPFANGLHIVVSVYRSTYRHEEVGSIILHDNSKNEDKRRGWANWVDQKMGGSSKEAAYKRCVYFDWVSETSGYTTKKS
jgi:hypothetical protein